MEYTSEYIGVSGSFLTCGRMNGFREKRTKGPNPIKFGRKTIRDFFVTELCFVMLRDAIAMIGQSRYISIKTANMTRREKLDMTNTTIPYARMAPLLFAIVIDTLGLGLVYPIFAMMFASGHSALLPLGTSLAMQHFYLGLGFLLYPLCLFFGASINGDLSDSFGRKKILIASMTGIGISYLCMAVGVNLENIYLLFFGRAMSGLMAGSYPIAQAAIIDLSTKETKSLNLSIVVLANVFGMILGPLLAGFTSDTSLFSYFNYAIPFYISSILGFSAALLIAISFKETLVPKTMSHLSIMRPIQIFMLAFQNHSIRRFSCAFLLMQVAWGTYFQFIILYLQQHYHYSNWQLGIFQSVLGLALAFGLTFIIRTLMQYFKNHVIAVLSLLITGVFMLLSSHIHQEIATWLFMLPIAAFDAVGFVAMLTAFSNTADANVQGRIMGITSAEYAIAFVIPGFFTNMIPLIGVPNILLMASLLMLAGGVLMVPDNKFNI